VPFCWNFKQIECRCEEDVANSDNVRFARDERGVSVTRADVPVLLAADRGSFYFGIQKNGRMGYELRDIGMKCGPKVTISPLMR
jgi:hypothetical protein